MTPQWKATTTQGTNLDEQFPAELPSKGGSSPSCQTPSAKTFISKFHQTASRRFGTHNSHTPQLPPENVSRDSFSCLIRPVYCSSDKMQATGSNSARKRKKSKPRLGGNLGERERKDRSHQTDRECGIDMDLDRVINNNMDDNG